MIINNFLNHESGTRLVLFRHLFYNWIKWIFKSIWFACVFMQIHNKQWLFAHDFWIKYHSVMMRRHQVILFFWSFESLWKLSWTALQRNEFFQLKSHHRAIYQSICPIIQELNFRFNVFLQGIQLLSFLYLKICPPAVLIYQ